MIDPILQLHQLSVQAGSRTLLDKVSLNVLPRSVLGIIGTSGAGKSTLLKTLNRLIDLTPGLQVSGQVLFHGSSIYETGVDADALRARIGILFQQPVTFPGSIYQNAIFGVRHLGKVPKQDWPAVAEQALMDAGLWGEVKDRLQQPARKLSVGQQQRLCLARVLANQPEVLLLDEPTSALDPMNTEVIENLLLRLKEKLTLVLVTHNLRQALRVADMLAFIAAREGTGQMLALDPPQTLFQRTDVPELSAFLSGELMTRLD